MSLSKLYLQVHGISISLKTNDEAFCKFVRTYFLPFVSEKKQEQVDISISLCIKPYFSSKLVFSNPKKVYGEQVSVSKQDVLCFQDGEVSVAVKQKGNRFQVTGEVRPHCLRHFLHLVLFGPKKTTIYYYKKLMKYAIHDVLFFVLQDKKNITVIHATAAEKNGSVLAFAGLGGAGKSTLMLSLVKSKDYKVFSDNYLLIKDSKAYLFPEISRVDKQSLKLIKYKQAKSADGNQYYVPLNQSSCFEASVKAIFIVNRSNVSSVKKLSNQQALDHLFAIGEYTREYYFHNYMVLSHLVFKTDSFFEKFFDLYDSITKSVPFFALDSSNDISKTIELVEERSK